MPSNGSAINIAVGVLVGVMPTMALFNTQGAVVNAIWTWIKVKTD